MFVTHNLWGTHNLWAISAQSYGLNYKKTASIIYYAADRDQLGGPISRSIPDVANYSSPIMLSTSISEFVELANEANFSYVTIV